MSELACRPDDPTLRETLQQLVDNHYLRISDESDRRRRGPGRGRRATV